MNDRIRAMQADALLQQDEERRRRERAAAQVRVNLAGSSISPAQAAAAERARKRLGMPAAPVPDPIVEQEARVEETMQELSESFRAIEWMARPDNAAVAADKAKELSFMDAWAQGFRTLTRTDDQSLMGARYLASGITDYLGMGLEGIGIGAQRAGSYLRAEGGRNIVQGVGGFVREVGERSRRGSAYLRGEEGSERALSSWAPDILPRMEKPSGAQGFALDVTAGLGQVGGAIATSPVSLPMLFGSGVSQANESVEEAQKREGREGDYTGRDDAALVAGGLVTGLSERMGINAILGRLPAPVKERLNSVAGKIIGAAVGEGSSEIAEGIGQNAISRYLLGNDTAILDGDIAYQGGVGATVGAVASALVQTAIPGRQHVSNQDRAQRAVAGNEAFSQAVEASRNSELRQASPERYEDFLKSLDDGGEVLIPAEKVAEFFQSNPDAEGWLDEWAIRDQFREALVAGTDVIMPQSAYLARVAPTEAHEAWADDIRFGMGEMSVNEARAFAEGGEASVTAEIDAALDQAEEVAPVLQAQARVYDDVRSKLREAGYTVDAADTQARMVAARYQTRAERNPERFSDAYAAYQETGLQVRQEFPEVIRDRMDRVDVMLEELRRGQAAPASQARIFGRSLMEYLAARGGVVDAGGELAAMNVEAWHNPRMGGKAFRRRFTRTNEEREGAFEFDGATQAAIEAGYLPEGATQRELLDAIREELAGRPTFSQQNETDLGAVENARALEELERLIADLGLDLSADNATIKAALERAANPPSDFPGDPNYDPAMYDQSGQIDTESEAFKAWAGTDEVLDPDEINDADFSADGPFVMRVYHGTTHDFDVFDASRRGTKEGQFGAVNYFTSSFSDADVNYAGEGPDLTNRIQRRAEEIEGEADGEVDYDQAVEQARKELAGAKPQTLEVYVRTEKPFVVGDGGSPFMEFVDFEALEAKAIEIVAENNDITTDEVRADLDAYQDEIDEARWEAESETENPLLVAIQTVADRHGIDPSQIFEDVAEFSSDGGRQSDLEQALRASEGLAYAEDAETGDLIGYHVLGEIIQELGFDSIILKNAESRFSSMDMEDGTAHIHVFDANNTNIKSVNNRGTFDPNDPNIYNQSTPMTGPRGQVALSENSAIIRLFASRDLTTFTHEMGHVWLEEMCRDARDPNASEQVKADFQTILDWFSAEAGQTITDADIGTDQHELWARGIERYMMEGKSPSVGLRDVFRSVMAWMKSIYRTVNNLNAPISDEVRGVMDRLFASDEEIAVARDASGQALGADVLSQMGATDAEVAAYEANLSRARSQAEDELLGRVMRAVRRQRTKEWNEAADAIREEIEADVDAMPDIVALDIIKRHGAMDREAVVAIMGGEAGLSMLPRPVPSIYSANGGQHPDMVAEASGYRSGAEMLYALMDYQAEHLANREAGYKKGVRQKRIDDEIRATLLDRFGDILNDGSIEQEALDAIHSERYTELLGVDLQVLGRRTGNTPAPIDALKQWARERVGARTVRQLRPDNYLRAERSASNAVQRALAAGNRDEAFRQKQAQAINNVLYVASSRAKRETEAVIARLRKLGRKRPSGIHVDYMDQIEAILDQFELREVSGRVIARRQSLSEFIAAQEAIGQQVNIPAEVIEATRKTNLEDLTVDEVMGLGDAVKHLEALGRLKSDLILQGKRRQMDELVNEAFERTSSLPNRKAPTVAGEVGLAERAGRFFLGAVASLRKMSEIARRLDNSETEGPFNTVLVQGGYQAADRKVELGRRFYTPIIEAANRIPSNVRNRYLDVVEGHGFTIPETGEPLTLRRGDLLVAALNVGTLSNFEKLAKGWGLISPEADAIQVNASRSAFVAWLDTQLDSTEWDFVEAHWNSHETLWQDYSAVARQLEGISPEPVEAAPVVLADRTLRGGYAPVIYHLDFDPAAKEREAKEQSDILGTVMRSGPRPDNGSTNARTAYVGPVDLRMSSQKRVIDQHLTYAAYGVYIDSALRFINDRRIRELVNTKLGPEIYKTLQPWLEGQVRGDPPHDPNATWMNQVARHSRSAVVSASLLGSATVLIAQLGGLPITASKIGYGRLAKGMARMASLFGWWGEGARDYVAEKSVFMRERLESGEMDRDIKFTLGRRDGVVVDTMRTYAGRAIAEVDFWMVSGPTWLAVYEQEIENGADEADAVFAADRAVNSTQGSGRAVDTSGIMRGNDLVKMSTIAFSWASAYENMVSGAVFDIRHGRNVGQSAMMLGSMMVLVPLADAFVSGDWPDLEDEDGAWAGVLKWFARNVFFNAFVGIPLARDFASYYERKLQGEYASGVGGTPYARLAGEGARLIKDIEAAIDEEKELSHRWPSHIVSAVGTVLGLPGTSQVTRTLNYGLDVREGDQNPDRPIDVATGVLRGPQEDQR